MGIDGVGEVMTGALAARAVEPATGAGADATGGGEASGAACLNCSTILVGDYCHRCGQSGHVHRSVAAWWHDIAHGVLHLDGKVWRTLPKLAFRPGELTRRYIDGQRASFVSPIAMFLFSVFLMFAVFSMVGGPFSFSDEAGQASEEMRTELAAIDRQIVELQAERERRVAAGEPVEDLDRRLADGRQARQVIVATARAFDPSRDIPTGPSAGDEGFRAIGFETGNARLDAAIAKANENPSLLLYKVQANAYKFSWALIPLSVPFVWLLFLWRRGHRVYDHTVFVTYSIAFMSLLLVTVSLLRPLGLSPGVAALALTFIPPIHMYKQLRGTYGLGRFSALWRTVFLIAFASVALTAFLLLLVTMGAFA